MKHLTEEEHRRRLANLQEADRAVTRCLARHRITDYLAGQVIYNLGEYPTRFSISPTEYDSRLLAEFAERGVRLIQFHEEYADPKRLFGADKFTSHAPEGLRQMIDLIHSLGMKVILDCSSTFFEKDDPDLRAEWRACEFCLEQLYWKYAYCSPASPGWRAYLLPRVERLLEDYGADGLYHDVGGFPREVQTREHDAALEDLLGIVYGLVHARGGVVKVHLAGAEAPRCSSRVYDYLWVGEGVARLDDLREAVKSHRPYVSPCPDLSRGAPENEDEIYLHSLPYMQFPLRVDGRPVTGERAFVPGIDYTDSYWTEHMRRIHAYYRQHPDGPYVYGWWDTPYGRPDARARWFYYLDLYRPMVAENTRCWLEIKESNLFRRDLPEGVVASLFVNEETYLVLANYGVAPATVVTSHPWRDRESGLEGADWTLPARALKFFINCEKGSSRG